MLNVKVKKQWINSFIHIGNQSVCMPSSTMPLCLIEPKILHIQSVELLGLILFLFPAQTLGYDAKKVRVKKYLLLEVKKAFTSFSRCLFYLSTADSTTHKLMSCTCSPLCSSTLGVAGKQPCVCAHQARAFELAHLSAA